MSALNTMVTRHIQFRIKGLVRVAMMLFGMAMEDMKRIPSRPPGRRSVLRMKRELEIIRYHHRILSCLNKSIPDTCIRPRLRGCSGTVQRGTSESFIRSTKNCLPKSTRLPRT